MSLLASQADFGLPDGTAGVLYSAGYHQYPFFTDRINALKGRFAPNNQTLLIAGCGFGYLVQLAVTAGYNAFGVDASSWAISQGQALLPSIATRLAVADVTSTSSLDAAGKGFGLHGNPPKYALLVTEDLLPCLTDAEITTALTNLRARSSSNLLHIITPGDGGLGCDPRITWKLFGDSATPAPAGTWRALLCPPDTVGNTETGLYWNSLGQV